MITPSQLLKEMLSVIKIRCKNIKFAVKVSKTEDLNRLFVEFDSYNLFQNPNEGIYRIVIKDMNWIVDDIPLKTDEVIIHFEIHRKKQKKGNIPKIKFLSVDTGLTDIVTEYMINEEIAKKSEEEILEKIERYLRIIIALADNVPQ